MKPATALICTLFLLPCHARAEDPPPKPDPVLLKAEESLRAVLADIDPEPSFEYPKHTKSLIVKYRTRKFMIHHGSKIGKYSEKAHEVEGPSYMGFMLKIHVQKAGFVNQPCVPQTIREPYWRTDLNVTAVKNADKQLYWALSLGSQVDQNHLKLVRGAIDALGETNQDKSSAAARFLEPRTESENAWKTSIQRLRDGKTIHGQAPQFNRNEFNDNGFTDGYLLDYSDQWTFILFVDRDVFLNRYSAIRNDKIERYRLLDDRGAMVHRAT